jgi:hypothetical protein
MCAHHPGVRDWRLATVPLCSLIRVTLNNQMSYGSRRRSVGMVGCFWALGHAHTANKSVVFRAIVTFGLAVMRDGWRTCSPPARLCARSTPPPGDMRGTTLNSGQEQVRKMYSSRHWRCLYRSSYNRVDFSFLSFITTFASRRLPSFMLLL